MAVQVRFLLYFVIFPLLSSKSYQQRRNPYILVAISTDHWHTLLCLFRCQPCVRIAPAFNMLSNKYPQVVFLEVDVHVCQVSVICQIHNTVFSHQILDTAGEKNGWIWFIFESVSSEIQFVVSGVTPGFTLCFTGLYIAMEITWRSRFCFRY